MSGILCTGIHRPWCSESDHPTNTAAAAMISESSSCLPHISAPTQLICVPGRIHSLRSTGSRAGVAVRITSARDAAFAISGAGRISAWHSSPQAFIMSFTASHSSATCSEMRSGCETGYLDSRYDPSCPGQMHGQQALCSNEPFFLPALCVWVKSWG